MIFHLDDVRLLAARPAFSPRYRFAEIRYLRAESRDKPARVETVVLFLPDVWRCAPTRLDWMNLQKAYAQKLQKKLNPDAEEPEEPQALIHSPRLFVDNLYTAMQPCCSSRVLLFLNGTSGITIFSSVFLNCKLIIRIMPIITWNGFCVLLGKMMFPFSIAYVLMFLLYCFSVKNYPFFFSFSISSYFHPSEVCVECLCMAVFVLEWRQTNGQKDHITTQAPNSGNNGFFCLCFCHFLLLLLLLFLFVFHQVLCHSAPNFL